MPANCVAYGCTNWFSGPRSLRLFRFPSEKRYPKRRAAWIRAVRRVNPDGSPWQPSAYSRICGAHFVNGCPSNLAKHPDYVPSIFNYTQSRDASAVHRWKRDRAKSTNSDAASQQLNIKTEPVDAPCPPTIPASSCPDATNSHAVSRLLKIKTEPVDAPCPRTIPASSCQDATNSDTVSQQLSIKTEPVDAPCLQAVPASSCQNEEVAGTSGSPAVGSQEIPAADASSYGTDCEHENFKSNIMICVYSETYSKNFTEPE